jgi:ADP-ribose pyrophosphatase YjhB (NUDIX family)
MSDYVAWLRHTVGPHLFPLVYATAIIRDEDGRILFQRRADFGERWWGLPGGLLEVGETPEECVRREVEEETGLRVEHVRLTGVYSSPRYCVTYPNGDQVQQITQCYACTIGSGECRPDGGEILDMRFFLTDQLPSHPLWYADMIRHALAGLPEPYFDPPESAQADTPFPTLRSVRRMIGSAPVLWPGAGALIVDEAGSLLLKRRSDNGLWGLPGGMLHVGETLGQTVIRGTLEETGLHVEPVRLITTQAGYEMVFSNGGRVFPVAHWFACQVVGGRLRADGAGATEVGFFARGNLPPLLPEARERLPQLLAEPRAIQVQPAHPQV